MVKTSTSTNKLSQKFTENIASQLLSYQWAVTPNLNRMTNVMEHLFFTKKPSLSSTKSTKQFDIFCEWYSLGDTSSWRSCVEVP